MELLEMRQKQQTNINDNFMIDKYYYKELLNVTELNADLIKPFLYNDIITNSYYVRNSSS